MVLDLFLSKILKCDISDDVIFLHYITTDNIGDLSCCPKNYFKVFDKCKEVEIYNYKPSDKDKVIIIGGGGLLQEYFSVSIENIIKDCQDKIIIFWGVGLDNSPTGKIFDTQILSSCNLVGVRDFNTQYKYVPCVSCMSKLFDKYKNIIPSEKIRCYVHSNYEFPEFLTNSFEIYKNNQNSIDIGSMEKVLEFLSGAEFIITNSYHGAYWATLLNKKVVALPFKKEGNIKFSDKFLTLKYKPVYVYNPEELKVNLSKRLQEAINYKDALEDSRRINIAFYKNVVKLINKVYKS